MVVLAGALACAATAMADSYTNSGDNLRTGWYPDAQISPQVVSSGTFGKLWSANVDGQVYAQPLVSTSPGGTRTVIVATETNHVYGLDPTTGTQQWTDDFARVGKPWNPWDLFCGDIVPSIGTTSTPVVDPSTNTVYLTHKVYASGSSGPAAWYLDALDAATGAERAGYPVKITTPNGADNNHSYSFDPTHEQQRPGLLLMNGVVYMGFGGHCDAAPWTGWIIGVNVSTRQTTSAWVDNTNGDGAGIWQSGVGLMSDGPNTLLFTTGNGSSPSVATPGDSPPNTFGESAVRLDVGSGGTLTPVDFFAPFDDQQLDRSDADFGSGAIVGLPDQYFGTPSIPHLALAIGKEGYVYLFNRDHLGGFEQGANGGDDVVQRLGGQIGGVWGRPGIWPGDGGYVYIASSGGQNGGGLLNVFKYGQTGSGDPALSLVTQSPDVFGWGSGSPIITSDGAKAGSALVWIIWSSDRQGDGAQLRAYNAVPTNGQLGAPVFEKPIGLSTNYSLPGVGDDGHLYVGTRDGHLLAFGSPVSAPMSGSLDTFPATPAGTSSPPQTLTLTANEPVTVSGITSSSPSQFQVGTPTPAYATSLQKGQTMTVPVTFSPGQAGPVAAQLTVETDAGQVVIPVAGTGQAGTAQLDASAPSVSLGATAIGGHLSSTASFTNNGNAPAQVQDVQMPAAPFSVTGAPAVGHTIAPGASVTVEIDFDPTQAGQFADDFEIDTQNQQVQVGLGASAGTPGVLEISPGSVDFGSVVVGTTETRTFWLSDTGGTNVTINKSKPPFGGAFAAISSLNEGTTIAPGQTVALQVSFTPAAIGSVTPGTWQITGDDGSGLHIVQFAGSGVAASAATSTSQGDSTPPPTGSRPPVVTHHPVTSPKAPRLTPAVLSTPSLGHAIITYHALVVGTSRFTVARAVTGRQGGHGCVALGRRNRHARSCTRWVTVASFSHRDRVGAIRIRLTTMVAARRLTPGPYRVQSVLLDVTGARHVFTTTLRITRPKR